MTKYKPIVLIILDGWGLSLSWGGNALSMNSPKNINELWRTYPHTVLQALSAISESGAKSPIADSHLGHTMIGAGRMVESNFNRITKTINNRHFYRNDVLLGAINWARKNNSNLHLMGMISEGGIHSHLTHLIELLRFCHQQNFNRVYIDAITDGTDSGPTDALTYIEKVNNKIRELKTGSFASVTGRKYAMDRDENWDLIRETYENLTLAVGTKYNSIEEAISANYREGANDEFIKPSLIKQKDGNFVTIKNNDAVIFFNYREDRGRELSQIFIEPNFHKFLWRPKQLSDLYFVTFVDYKKSLPAKVAFPEQIYQNTLVEMISKFGLRQLKLAESEKQAHVTAFINGGNEDTFPGEERKIISSPHVSSYDKMPAMRAVEIAKNLLKAISSKNYDFIAINFANVDMIAHTGNIVAVGQAVQILDLLIGEIVKDNLKMGGATIITADHGNAEQMVNLNKSLPHDRETLHTLNPVPFILVAPDMKKNLIKSAIGHEYNALSKIIQAKDTLADVAPTVLEMMGIPKPVEMTGHSLLNKLE